MLLNRPLLMTAPQAMPLKLNLEALRHVESSLENHETEALKVNPHPDEIEDLISRGVFRAPLDVIGKFSTFN